MGNNPKAFGVSVLIQKDGLILAVARRNDPNDWGLPGGKIGNETEKEAAIRETFEETGLVIWDLVEINRRNCGPDLAATFTCKWSGEPQTQPGEPECKWQPPNIITKGCFGEYNKNLFDKMGIEYE